MTPLEKAIELGTTIAPYVFCQFLFDKDEEDQAFRQKFVEDALEYISKFKNDKNHKQLIDALSCDEILFRISEDDDNLPEGEYVSWSMGVGLIYEYEEYPNVYFMASFTDNYQALSITGLSKFLKKHGVNLRDLLPDEHEPYATSDNIHELEFEVCRCILVSLFGF